VLLEIVLLVVLHVLKKDLNEVIPIRSRLFMPKADGMTNLMNYCYNATVVG